ncbi:MAG: response regulator [Methanobacterium sp.]
MENIKIIVVEDERITAEDIKDALESTGYQVPGIASSGEDAIKKAEEFLPDLMLMDIMLEGEMDGIEAAEQIRERFGIPVIYLTAYSDSSTVQRAKITEPSGYILKEPFGFIHKPFEESELHTAIEITLYRHKMEKRLREHEQWLSTILKNVNDAIIITNQAGQIKFINPMAEDITGWIQTDAIGENLDEIFKVSSEGFKLNIDSKNFTAGRFNNVLITSKEGNKVSISGSITPIKNGVGNIDSMVVVFRNKK